MDLFLTVSTIIGLLLATATLLHQLFLGDASAPQSLLAAKNKSKNNVTINKEGKSKTTVQTFLHQQRHFLIGFALMSLGDWLQGPYLFSMYDSAGLARSAQLDLYSFDFLLGAILSVCVGVVSDLGGRKQSCALYGIFYGLSCLCNHFPGQFSILALGCAVDGLCNALLRCAFESYWAETARQTLTVQSGKTSGAGGGKMGDRVSDEDAELWIGHTLALSQWAATLCSLVAGLICYACVHFVGEWWTSSGLLASLSPVEAAVEAEKVKFTATMDLAAIVLFAGSLYIWIFWESDSNNQQLLQQTSSSETGNTVAGGKQERVKEDAQTKRGVVSVLTMAFSTLPLQSKSAACIFFLEVTAEAALLIFICLYPSLLHTVFKIGGGTVPFGVIFTQLMAALAVGSYYFSYSLSSTSSASGAPSTLAKILPALQWSTFASAVSISVLYFTAKSERSALSVSGIAGSSSSGDVVTAVVLGAMWIFEVAAGVYLSALGALHEQTLESNVRASSVGIIRMLSYGVAWTAVSLYRFIPGPREGSASSSPSVAAREEVLAWSVCCGASVCCAVSAFFGLIFMSPAAVEKENKSDPKTKKKE